MLGEALALGYKAQSPGQPHHPQKELPGLQRFRAQRGLAPLCTHLSYTLPLPSSYLAPPHGAGSPLAHLPVPFVTPQPFVGQIFLRMFSVWGASLAGGPEETPMAQPSCRNPCPSTARLRHGGGAGAPLRSVIPSGTVLLVGFRRRSCSTLWPM